MSRENVSFHKWRMLLSASWYRSRMLLNILKYIGQTIKNYLAQNDNITKVERPWYVGKYGFEVRSRFPSQLTCSLAL